MTIFDKQSVWRPALKWFAVGAALLGFFYFTQPLRAEIEDIYEMPAQTEEQVLAAVKICRDSKCNSGHGTAFPLYDGYFLTAGHITNTSTTWFLKTSKGFIQSAKTIWTSVQSDWGLVKTDGFKYMDLPKTTINCGTPKQGQKISNISNPADMEFVVVHGYIASKAQKKLGNWKEVFPMVLPGFGGSSGSPVFNESNEVIGNVVGGLRNGEFSIMEPISKICDILPQKKED